MWTDNDAIALKQFFETAWDMWCTKFQVFGFTVSWWSLFVSVFAIWLIFKLARGIFEI